ncbi:MAG: hypothetical protein ACYDAO_02040 [Thermoplasmataceae archaeon]
MGLIFYGDYILYRIPGNFTITLYSYSMIGMAAIVFTIMLLRHGTIEKEPANPIIRFLKVSLGILWIIDGILQLQPEMPYIFLPYVLYPTLSSSPNIVYNIMLPTYNMWTQHPVIYNAAAAVIQLLIGIGLLTRLTRIGNRFILILSALWSITIWIFGEGFGGIFSAGSSFLSGLPGSALIYFFISIFLLLSLYNFPVMKLLSTMMASIFIISFVFQVVPKSGFWSRYLLSRIPYNFIFYYQPSFLSKIFIFFSNSFIYYVFEWNLFFSISFLVAGFLWVWIPKLAAPVSIPIIAFSWFIGQDFGIVGGAGTDPNTGLPLILVSIAFLLAFYTKNKYHEKEILTFSKREFSLANDKFT